jgi:hypothetical protein
LGAFETATDVDVESADDSEMEAPDSFKDLVGRLVKYISGEGGVVLMYQPHWGLS